jgi:quercetin 2,3-dioxygenase
VSGPVSVDDAPTEPVGAEPSPACVEITESHEAVVGSLTVRRALPRRARRTVGAWCFVDHMGPVTVTESAGVDIGPHPHIGLQTVTWLLAGEVLHRDSLGSEQVIRPGQLNLMSAGRGVVHAEEHTGHYRGQLHGVQLWVAQPAATRHGDAAFEHHAVLPQLELDAATATVLVGQLGEARSHARRDTDHFGASLSLRAGRSVLPLDPHHEHAVVVLDGAALFDDQVVTPGHLAYLGTGRDELVLAAREPSTALLLGGKPFESPVLMWWNFVARTREEIDRAWRDWDAGNAHRFGPVASRLDRITVGPPPWSRPASA